MKKVLVTGSKGFIGESLVAYLKKMEYEVLGFNSEDGDISDCDIYEKYKPVEISYIFHLASKTFIPSSWEHPVDFYKTSIIGTQQVLELCRKKNIPMTFVSAYVYGISEKLPIAEITPLNPNNPYAHSKYLTEELCKFYSDYYNVKITIIRPFNIYGKNQKDYFLIPHIIKQVLDEEEIKVKDLNPKRDYIYLDDLICGLIKTMTYKKKFSIFNLGSGVEYSVKEIIDIIQNIFKTDKSVISDNIERKNEITRVVADISKAKEELDWSPRFSFREGIKDILEKMSDER